LDPTVAMHHLIIALKLGAFVNNICKKPTSNQDELRRRAAKYMQMEKLVKYRNQIQTYVILAKKDNDKPSFNKAQDDRRRDQPPENFVTLITHPSLPLDLISWIGHCL